MFSLVMPITRFSYLLHDHKQPSEEHDNIQRFFRVGWKTLEKYLQWKDVHRFYVILPAQYKQYFETQKSLYVKTDLLSKFEYILEEDLVQYPIEKYRVQMLSKLLIANHVKTSHYLVIDDDIILMRSFGMKDLFSNGITRQVRYTSDKTFHKNWWKASAEALHLPYDGEKGMGKQLEVLRKKHQIMSVTPEILITKEVQHLMKYLSSLHKDWEHTLMHMKPRWTEYTLYWLYLVHTNKLGLYRGSPIRLSDNDTNIWYHSGNLEESIKKMWKNKKQYFGVIQSNVPEHTYTLVEKVVSTTVLS